MRAFCEQPEILRLLQLGFLVRNVLTRDGIVLLDLHLFRHGALVLGGRVEMTGAGCRFQLDFFPHGITPLNLLAARAHVGQNSINAVLVDGAQPSVSQSHANPAIFALNPELAILQIWQKTALGSVIRMRHVVPRHRRLAGNLTYSGHDGVPKSKTSIIFSFYESLKGNVISPDNPPPGKPAERLTPRSKQSALRKRENIAARHDEVVEHARINQRQRLFERSRQLPVCLTRFRYTGRMVVGEDG